jgi:hypothetical protein
VGAQGNSRSHQGADGVGAGAASTDRGWNDMGGRVGGGGTKAGAVGGVAKRRRAEEEQRRAGSCCLSSQPAECPQDLVGVAATTARVGGGPNGPGPYTCSTLTVRK